MRILRDHRGNNLRLTDERLAHIREHPEMVGAMSRLEETLRTRDTVVQSAQDEHVHLYYRRYAATPVGDKLLCVVVKSGDDDRFILTAYFTDSVKRGRTIWRAES